MKMKVFAAALAAFLMLPFFGTVAYAGGGEPEPEATPAESSVPEPEDEGNPFTPDGTGTVLDNATDGDGKEFYTITTANDNVFYLIIDNQRSGNNVYFLNAVTEADLLALAEPSENVSAIPDPEPEQAPGAADDPGDLEDDPADEQPTEPEKKSSKGTMLLLLLLAAGGGGAGYYFKILRPKQQQAADPDDEYEGEFDDYDEGDPYAPDQEDSAEDYGSYGGAEPEDDDTPPWDVDEDEASGEDGEA